MSPSAEQRLFSEVVSRPVAMAMVCLAALVFGYVSYKRLPVELMPDISYPTITVRTPFEGAAPEEVESQVSREIESRLATLDGLVSLESRSRANQSDVLLGFTWGQDMSQAAQSVRESLQSVFFVDGVERPILLRYDPSLDPFLRIGLSVVDASAESDLFLLRDVAEREIKRDLETIPGVAAVQVRGGLEREIRIQLREEWMGARQISLAQVQAALRSENVNLAGGSIIEGNKEYLIRTINQFRSARDIETLKIARGDGIKIPLSDVATITTGHRDREVLSFLNGNPAVELEVYKEADANIVAVAQAVKSRLIGNGSSAAMREAMGVAPPIAETLPEEFTLALLDDQARFIEAAVSNLRNTVLLGGGLAVLVLFLFLRNFRSTVIIGLAIPVSVMISFAPLFLWDVSLNLMSLGGLALGVGMLVDNGVVVLESIQRYLDEGADRVDAAVRGVGNVAAAVTASTLTTVAVFFPITFVEGVAGELFGDLAIAVVASLVASLAVALFLVPTLAALRFGGGQVAAEPTMLNDLTRFWTDADNASLRPLMQRVFFPLHQAAQESGEWLSRALSPKLAGRLHLPTAERVGIWRRLWSWIVLPYVVLRIVLNVVLGVLWNCLVFLLAVAGRLIVQGGAFVVWPASILFGLAAKGFYAVYGPLDQLYGRALPAALMRPGRTLGLVTLAVCLAVLLSTSLGSELIPELHQGRFTVEAALPVGTPIERTVQETHRLEKIIASHPAVKSVYATVGADRRADTGSDEGEHTARIRVELEEGGDVAAREQLVMSDFRERLNASSSMELNMVAPAMFSFKTPVEVMVFGYDLSELKTTGDLLVDELSGLDGMRDVRSSQQQGYPELRILYDRARLKRYDLDTYSVATRVRDRIQGVEATSINEGDRSLSVRVQLTKSQRETTSDLRSININPNLTPPIPLDAVAEIEEGYGPSEIRRIDQQRAVVISASLQDFDLGSASKQIDARLSGITLPEGITYEIGGQSKEMQASLQSLWMAMLLAIFLVYVIMASSFESIVHPFVILFSVPLALVGVSLTLWVLDIDISAVVAIGAIVLAGVVVNNAIVLVDTINRLRTEGLSRDDAILRAGALRLRPILMTTTTTVLGLVPLAVAPLLVGVLPDALTMAEGIEIQQPLAVTLIGGLLSSTLLTLVIVPVLYRLMTRAAPGQAAQT